MSVVGHKRKSHRNSIMSALTSTTDIRPRRIIGRKVPKAEIPNWLDDHGMGSACRSGTCWRREGRQWKFTTADPPCETRREGALLLENSISQRRQLHSNKGSVASAQSLGSGMTHAEWHS